MISVTSSMIFGAIAASLVLGVISGVTYAFLLGIYAVATRLFAAILKREKEVQTNSAWRNIFDFFFTLTVGVVYVLILYAFTDGVFFILPLLALFLGVMAGKRFLKVLFAFKKMHKR